MKDLFIGILYFIVYKMFLFYILFWKIYWHMTTFKLDISSKMELNLMEMPMIQTEGTNELSTLRYVDNLRVGRCSGRTL